MIRKVQLVKSTLDVLVFFQKQQKGSYWPLTGCILHQIQYINNTKTTVKQYTWLRKVKVTIRKVQLVKPTLEHTYSRDHC